MGKRGETRKTVIAVSGGPDSVYLASTARKRGVPLILAHFNHRARGKESDEDQEFVEALGRALGIPVSSGRASVRRGRGGDAKRGRDVPPPAGFEEKARKARYAFLQDVMNRRGAKKLLLAHTADDQVETVLMRVLEGAGISGLKGIPRKTNDGIVRPLMDTWREEVLEHLHTEKIPYRIDKSNADTRFERNWIRHVLVPLLEKRYGKGVKKRIHALGERLREIDAFLDDRARKWLKRNAVSECENGTFKAGSGPEAVTLKRLSYSRLPAALRKKILQLISYETLGIGPNERLLESMDRLTVSRKPYGRLNIGKGWTLALRYGDAIFLAEKTSTKKAAKGTERSIDMAGEAAQAPVRMSGPGVHRITLRGSTRPIEIAWEEKGKISPSGLRRIADGERAAVFDRDALRAPLSVRPLRAGDRIRPFGMDADKKVKEILIDRKVPREERWGRPVVCDEKGEIVWIPGVVRSSHAPVAPGTARTVLLRAAVRGASAGKLPRAVPHE